MPLPIPQDIDELKAFFITGATPTQEQFYAWLETMFHYIDTLNARMTAAEAAAAKAFPQAVAMISRSTGGAYSVAGATKVNIDSVTAVSGLTDRDGCDIAFTSHIKTRAGVDTALYAPLFSLSNYTRATTPLTDVVVVSQTTTTLRIHFPKMAASPADNVAIIRLAIF